MTHTIAEGDMSMDETVLTLLWMLPVYGLLLKIALCDHRTCRIPNADVGLFLCYAIIFRMLFGEIYIISALCLLIIGLVLPALISFFLKRPEIFGMGDVKLMSVCALLMPPDHLGGFLCCSGVFAWIYYAIFRKNPMPFAPAIGGAFVVMNFWKMPSFLHAMVEKILTVA
jgi:Flp pilus assembly protein protease CpaA